MQNLNIFPIGNFWKTSVPTLANNKCGTIVSIIILCIISILFVLKFISLVTLNSVFWTSNVSYDFQPQTTSFTTSQDDSSYTQFMLGFGIINDATCAASIPFQVFINTVTTSPYASTTKLPINLQACTNAHFAKLPGGLNKVREWTQKPLYCLPLNSYFQFSGSSSISSVYKSLSFNFNCPASCSSTTCGQIEMYTQNTIINVQNTTAPFAYSLARKVFTVYNAPTYQNIYQLEASSVVTDKSLLPFSLNSQIYSVSMGQFITDIASTNPTTTILTIQRSDQTVNYRRSYFKLFDLFSYIGGIIQAFLILFLFMNAIARLQFQIKFAGDYFRTNDFKNYQFTGYLKLLFYGFLTAFRCKLNWRMAQKSEETKELVNKLLNVVYLNKRIAFLEEAIGVLLKQHQLKGIHLLHSLSKEKTEKDIRQLKYRDRMVYYLNKKVKFDKNINKNSESKPNSRSQKAKMLTKKGHYDVQQLERVKNSEQNPNNSCSIGGELKSGGQVLHNDSKMGRVSYKKMLQQRENGNQQKQEPMDTKGGMIINQAEDEFGQQSLSDQFDQPIVHNQEDMKKLKKEAQFVGFMSVEQLNEPEIAAALQNDLKILVHEAQSNNNGDQVSRRIYQKLDVWLKNELKNMIIRRHHGESSVTSSNLMNRE